MKTLLAISVVALLWCSACSTRLEVRAIPIIEPKKTWLVRSTWAGEPQGIVVNRLATYSVKVTPQGPWLGSSDGKPATLVDPHRVLEINYERMPFADGKLTLQLVKNAQTILVGGVSGTTPVTNVVKAADTALGTAAEIEKLDKP